MQLISYVFWLHTLLQPVGPIDLVMCEYSAEDSPPAESELQPRLLGAQDAVGRNKSAEVRLRIGSRLAPTAEPSGTGARTDARESTRP